MFFRNVLRRALPYDFIKQDSTITMVFEKTWYVSIFFGTKSINLIKSHEGLKGRVVFARRCFTIKLIWKNIHSKETVMKSFFQLGYNLRLYWKRTPSQLFSDDFRKTFHNTVLCQNASKSCKGLKGTEAFARRCSIKKLISKISQNSAKRNCNKVFFLVHSQVATLLK